MLYSRKTTGLFLFLLTVVGAGTVLSHPTLVPTSTLAVLQASTIGLGISSKVPQIIRNFKAGGTGQLSRATVFMQFGGSAARLFTLLQEVKDTLLIVSCGISVSLNLVNVSQMIYYNSGKASKHAKVNCQNVYVTKTRSHQLNPPHAARTYKGQEGGIRSYLEGQFLLQVTWNRTMLVKSVKTMYICPYKSISLEALRGARPRIAR